MEAIYSFGKMLIDGYRVVGKGHAAVVVLARHRDYGIIALKIRRMDSKRASLKDEAELLETIHRYGYAPKVYLYTDDFILREYIDGLTIEEFLGTVQYRDDIAHFIKSLLLATYTLDELGIDVGELSRPYRQIVLLCGDPSKPFFIDLESGKRSVRPSNVTRIINFIITGCRENYRIREALKIDRDRALLLIGLAREYKKSPSDSRGDVLNKILSVLGIM